MTSSSNSSDSDYKIDWSEFNEYVERHDRFLLTTHIRPDCDALGSTLAMATVLERLGKEVEIVLGYDVPPNLHWIDPRNRIRHLNEFSPEQLEAFDAMVILDTSAWAQLSHVEQLIRNTKAQKIVIDHHQSGDDIGARVFKESSSEATGRIVAEAAEHLGVELTPEMATQLFAAIVTDTGWLHFSSTNSDSYRLAARLVDAGAVPERVYAELNEKETLGRLILIGIVLSRVKTDLDGRLIYTYIERKDFEAAGALPTDSEDVINMTLAVKGTQVAIILVEQPDGGFKISFRSRCNVDCAKLAEQFGGGGHKAAAGAFICETLEIARTRVLDAARAAMR
ncbi:MAG: DHH family phosphoesterase [Pirellulales bacterium]|nr:DHH family phosphoesterase [Pirellulales bacterium]